MYAKAQLLIPRSAQASTSDNFTAAQLAAGEAAVVYLHPLSDTLAAYKTGTATSDTSDLTSNAHNKFQIMWRKANTSDVIITTPELSLSELVRFKKVAKSDGTAQVTTVTPTVSSPVLGDRYSITLVNTTPGTANLEKWNFETINTIGADFAASDLLDQWTSDINAMSDTTKIQMSDGGTAANLVGTTKLNHFRVAIDCDSATAVINYATDLVTASGTYAQMVEMERNMKAHGEGITNSIWFPKPWNSELSDTTYDLGVFEFKLSKPAKHGMQAVNSEDYTLYIAEPTDINLIDMLEAAWNVVK
jgi:hypothetical protein